MPDIRPWSTVPAMQRWEYTSVGWDYHSGPRHKQFTEQINALGRQGWEAVAMHHVQPSPGKMVQTNTRVMVLMKRPLPSPADSSARRRDPAELNPNTLRDEITGGG